MNASKLYKWANFAQRLIYPPLCLLCDAPTSEHAQPGCIEPLDLCHACWSELPRITKPCPICGLPLPAGVSSCTPCGQCQKHPPGYAQLTSLFAYKGAARFLIHQLKYQQQMACARLLGTLLAQQLQNRQQPLPDRIIPIPLHRKRLRERGFNQSLEIARPISRRLGIPIDVKSCARVRDTASQSSLNAKQRRQNLRKAFSCGGLNEARHIAIVDDVVTTAATVEALAKLLHQHGAQQVEVWSVARA